VHIQVCVHKINVIIHQQNAYVDTVVRFVQGIILRLHERILLLKMFKITYIFTDRDIYYTFHIR
jgi:hypothetical protein